jgi:hypothetical protein
MQLILDLKDRMFLKYFVICIFILVPSIHCKYLFVILNLKLYCRVYRRWKQFESGRAKPQKLFLLFISYPEQQFKKFVSPNRILLWRRGGGDDIAMLCVFAKKRRAKLGYAYNNIWLYTSAKSELSAPPPLFRRLCIVLNKVFTRKRSLP